MNPVDILLSLSIPTLVLVHLLITPYTKIEESFNLEATHDLLRYGFPSKNISANLAATYDHVSYPGPVPRTFVGSVFLASVSKPIISLIGFQHAEFVVRAVLGMLNAFALLRFESGLARAFGTNVGRWYVLLQASQFHVIFYASRTLPNMFAFGLTTLALAEFLPSLTPSQSRKKQQRGIFLFVLAGVLFRSEVAAYLFAQLLYLLIQSRISLQIIIPAGLISAAVALATSVPIDSYFYQKLIWPELAGFYFNAIQGNASGWGTSPWYTYFTHSVPRLLLNPLTLHTLIPLSLFIPATKTPSRALFTPALLFIALYSLLPHKEPRFIIYTVPALTASASLSASYIWTRRSKSLLYRLGSLLLAASIPLSLLALTVMLLISSLNYPGGEALHTLHKIIHRDLLAAAPEISTLDPRPSNLTINIHTDTLSTMTGVSLFLQSSPNVTLTIPSYKLQDSEIIPVIFQYDKSEREDYIEIVNFWEQLDYALMEQPEFAVGEWDVVGTAWAYEGMVVLRPGERGVQSDMEQLAKAYHGNQAVDEEHGLGREEVKEAVEWLEARGEEEAEDIDWVQVKKRWMEGEKDRFEIWRGLRDFMRLVTGGWYVGPGMEPDIRILRRGDGRKLWEGRKGPLVGGKKGVPWRERGGRKARGGVGP